MATQDEGEGEVSSTKMSPIPPTMLLYQTDTYLFQAQHQVLGVELVDQGGKKPKGIALMLSSTIFHPQGGGQPCDVGVITLPTPQEIRDKPEKQENLEGAASNNAAGEKKKKENKAVNLHIPFVANVDGVVYHFVDVEKFCSVDHLLISEEKEENVQRKEEGGRDNCDDLAEILKLIQLQFLGQMVSLQVDSHRRLENSASHTAGHLLAAIVEQMSHGVLVGTKGHHFPDGPYVQFQGDFESLIKENPSLWSINHLNECLAQQVQKGLKVSISSSASIPSSSSPKIKSRFVTIDSFPPCPCGGTHLQSLTVLESVEVRKLSGEKDVKISYKCTLKKQQ